MVTGRPVPANRASASGVPANRASANGAPADGMPGDEAYRIVRSRIDLTRLAPLSRYVTERVIVASADFDYATDLVCDERVLVAGVAEIAAGMPVIADSVMVAAGIPGYPVICKSEESLTERLSRTAGISKPAAAVRLAFGQAGPGAIWVVGCAAEALAEIMSRNVQPALVIALPVGLDGAAEAKDALRASGLPALTNMSEKGGAAVAAAAFCALADAARAAAGAGAGAEARPGSH
jgi:precorrin-8X/cobalt-precorrin-8 methylmutase